jgi:hypothetical protein
MEFICNRKILTDTKYAVYMTMKSRFQAAASYIEFKVKNFFLACCHHPFIFKIICSIKKDNHDDCLKNT